MDKKRLMRISYREVPDRVRFGLSCHYLPDHGKVFWAKDFFGTEKNDFVYVTGYIKEQKVYLQYQIKDYREIECEWMVNPDFFEPVIIDHVSLINYQDYFPHN